MTAAATAAGSRLTKATTYTSALVSTETQSYSTTILTLVGSQTVASVITTSRLVPVTTGFATITATPSLGQQSGSSGSSGLSNTSKKVIGGVIGGVCGAALLGGILLVAWRLWGRKRASAEEEDLMSDSDFKSSVQNEKAARARGGNPFQNGLEQYHNPTNVNQSSNF